MLFLRSLRKNDSPSASHYELLVAALNGSLPAPHSKRCGGEDQESQEEGGGFWDMVCPRTTGDRLAEVCLPEIIVGLLDDTITIAVTFDRGTVID